MKVEFEPTPGAVETYTLIGEPEEGVKLTLGKVSRVSDDEWKFEAATEEGVIAVGPMVGELIKAKDLEELQHGFQCNHLGRIKVPRGNQLKDKTMERFADAQLHNLLALASKTDSVAGYTAALADATSQLLFECFDTPDKREQATEAVIGRIHAGMKRRANWEAEGTPDTSEIAAGLKALFDRILGGPTDDDEGKHEQPSKPHTH